MILLERARVRGATALLVGILAVVTGALLTGCADLDEGTYITVMVESLRLEAERGLPPGEAMAEAARSNGTTVRQMYEYSRWLFRDRDTDVEVAAEIARRGRPYLQAPHKGLPNPHEP
jgi:hypothetical protein